MSLFRRRPDPGPVPVDLALFDQRTWESFASLVSDELGRRGREITFVGGQVRIGFPSPEVFGLINLAQVCHGTQRRRWPTIIRGHFEGMARTAGALAEFDEDFVKAAPILKARFQPADPPPGIGGEFSGVAAGQQPIRRPFAEGLSLAVTLDLPDAVVGVTEDRRSRWDVEDDELFTIALANVRVEGPPARETVRLADGTPIITLESHSFFTTTWVQWLEEAASAVMPDAGALVAVPNRHLLMVHPLEDAGVVKAVQHLITLTRRFHDQGPGALSRHLYWWRDGALAWLPASVDDDRIEFYPPSEFVDILNRLGP